MTHEELKNLVSYTTSNRRIVYYSELECLTPTSMLYAGNTITISEELSESLANGKAEYEAYKLSMARSDAEDIINNKVDSIIEVRFAETLQATINTISSWENTAKVAEKLVKEATDNTLALQQDLNTKISNLDFDHIQRKVTEKLDDVIELKSEFKTVVRNLKSLFKD